MQIWVDADACPRAIKEVLVRAAQRRRVLTVFVANRDTRLPPDDCLRSVRVKQGFDVADREIVDRISAGDLVVTADVPLAADVVERGATALNPRGTLYTEDNVQELLAQRDLMDELRSLDMVRGGPPPFGAGEVRAFSNQLDRFLTRNGA
ncbi:hypothetical protein ABI59_23560 [Acidobacteria bacterium Mor1]|nr:hypothetical protein ABI59_23560 [Acidobacteria bacterium Mor1]